METSNRIDVDPGALPSPRLVEEGRAGLAVLKAQLLAQDYTSQRLMTRIGGAANASTADILFSLQELVLSQPLPGTAPTPLEVLMQFFLACAPVPRKLLEGALSAQTVEVLLQHQLAHPLGDGDLVSTATLFPFEEVYAFCDRLDRRHAYHGVYFPDVSASSIADLLPPAPGEPKGAALDLGTGSGVLAISMAVKHGFSRVTALDLNPRAVAFTALGAALNGCQLELIEGTWDDLPERGKQAFDLVTFALPFVYAQSPRQSLAVLSPNGGGLLEGLYAELPGLLSPGGRAVFFHQRRTRPADHLDSLCTQALQDTPWGVVWRPSSQDFEGVEFGNAVVELRTKKTDPVFRVVRAPAANLCRKRQDLARTLRSMELLVEDGLMDRVPVLFDDVFVYEFRTVVGGAMPEAEYIHVGDVLMPREAASFIHRVDGKRSLKQLVAPTYSEEAVRKACSRLVLEGAIYFKG